MKLSEKISTCKICRENANWIDPNNADDLFQQAWLDIWEFEQRNPIKASQVRNYKSYFFRTLKTRMWNNAKAKRHFLDIDFVNESKVQEVEESDPNTPSEAFLLEWINSSPENEIDHFYKNIITLVLRCKNNNDAIRMLKMCRKEFYSHLKNAKQKLKDDFILSSNLDHIHRDSMV